MFLFDWFYSVLATLGLRQREAKILLLGSDNGAKTNLLNRLNNALLVQHQPAEYPTYEELGSGKINFRAFGLGSYQVASRVQRDYYANVDAVVYFMDTTDKERFDESMLELNALLRDRSRPKVPLLIIIDTDNTLVGIINEFWFYNAWMIIQNYRNNLPIEVFMCSIVRKMGYGEGIKWLSQYVR